MQSPSLFQWWFCRNTETYSKIHMKMQKDLNNQNNLEKEGKNWRTHTSWVQNLLPSYSNQNGAVLSCGQIDRCNATEPRSKPSRTWPVSDKVPRPSDGRSTNGAGKAELLHAKEWRCTLSLRHMPKKTPNRATAEPKSCPGSEKSRHRHPPARPVCARP